MRASRGSSGIAASCFPVGVSRRSEVPLAGTSAPSSSSSATPSLTCRLSGGSRKGNAAMSPRPSAVIDRITDARLVRRISGSVNSGRARKLSSL